MTTPLVSVCVTTFRRPRLLDFLLASLAVQELPPPFEPASQLEVVVVDNDADGSGRTVSERWAGALPFPLSYVVEHEQNISRARNRAVALSQGAAIAFIDDDERADPHWLASLLAAAERYDADVVFGAVVPEFAHPVPDWLAENPYFTLGRVATGTIVASGGAGNCLIRRDVLQRVDDPAAPFDVGLGRTGGEDAHLFDRLGRAGARLVFCAEAVATEYLPPERLRLRWVVRRAFRTGNMYARRQVELAAHPRAATANLALRASAVVVLSATRALCSRYAVGRVANGLRAVSGFGQLTGLLRVPVRGY